MGHGTAAGAGRTGARCVAGRRRQSGAVPRRAAQACGGKVVIGESAGFEFDTEKTLQVVGAQDLAQSLGVPLLNLDRRRLLWTLQPWKYQILPVIGDAN